jgi:hemerythrin-like domain-containing protein
MIRIAEEELGRIERRRKVDPRFVEALVDFIRTYADRCHHGKEEDILFRDLQKKALSNDQKRILEELVEEHKQGRSLTKRLTEANERYADGDPGALSVIVECIRSLADFYPRHIEKEDRHFFLPVMGHFTPREKDAMLKEEYEFDRQLIHEKYSNVVQRWQSGRREE